MRVILNVIWFVFAGLWTAFRPFGRDVVSIEEARRRGLEQQVALPAGPV